MSGQWEVVGKKKDRSSKLPVPKVNGQSNKESKLKKTILSSVSIEEVLPKSQVQTIYNKTNKENKKPVDTAKVQDGTKKPPKKEKQEPPKPKAPKSIESALNMIDVEEFKLIYEKSKAHFPDAPIVSLKELVQFLNQKISLDIQDPLFSSKPEGYPLYVVPASIKSVIEKSIKEAGKDNAKLFFDISLTTLATDMSKNLPGIGYRFYLQYIALNEPRLVTENVNKYSTLLKSYQNRPNIGLSVLWAVGHVGINDFQSGLTVFQEMFLPLLDMKHYTRYVLSYLLRLISNPQETTLTKEQFLLILDTVYSNTKNFPTELTDSFASKIDSLKPLLFKNSKEKYHNYVEFLLKKVVTSSNKPYQDCLCDILVEIFNKDQTTLSNWNKLYSKNVAASAVLLKFIGDNWNTVSKKLNKGVLKELLDNFYNVNKELSLKKRVEDGLTESVYSIKKINEKMATKKSSGFPFKTLSFLMALCIGGLIYYDINTHGSWNDSKTHKTLKEYGICEYSAVAVGKAKEGVNWVDAKIEGLFPGYHKTVADFSSPYIQLFTDTGKVIYYSSVNIKDAIVEKYPVVIQSIDSYAPGLIEQSQNVVSNAYSTSVFYVNRSIDYLKTEVFVGQLSPENVRTVIYDAINATQQKTNEYVHWILRKIETSIK